MTTVRADQQQSISGGTAPVVQPLSLDGQRITHLPRRTHEHTLPGGTWHPSARDADPSFLLQTPEQAQPCRQCRPRCATSLRPVQRAALVEAAFSRGALITLRVGGGKTLISMLLGAAVDATNPLVLVPSALLGQWRRDREAYLRHWKLPATHVLSHEVLGHPKHEDDLWTISPDLIVVDEASGFGSSSARARRLFKYLAQRAKENRPCTCVFMSGTLMDTGLLNLERFAAFSLRDRCPLPLVHPVAVAWDDVIRKNGWGSTHADIDALISSESRHTGTHLTAREAFRSRLLATVGVIGSMKEELGVSLNLHARELKMPENVEAALTALDTTWRSPDGDELTSVLDKHRWERSLSTGLTRTWRQRPPQQWLDARARYNRSIRDMVGSAGFDSPVFAHRYARSMPHMVAGAAEWFAVEGLSDGERLWHWVSTFLVEDATKWGRQHVGVIWVLTPMLGQAIAEALGTRYYGAGIDGIDMETGNRTVVASILVNGAGKNLQQWSKALVVELPASNKRWEQLLGRHHRFGQQATSVDFWLYQFAEVQEKALAAARHKARIVEDLLGDEQKLNLAAFTWWTMHTAWDVKELEVLDKEDP